MSQPQQSSGIAIQSVQRALAILQCFTVADSELGVTNLSRELDLHKSTVSRLLATLELEGFVEKNPETGKYRLGLQLVTLAGIVLDQINLRELAGPYLISLAELTQETVNIIVLSGRDSMNLVSIPSPNPIRFVGRMGRRTPCHCAAGGKILLAHLTPEARRRILPNKLPAVTQKTITDYDVLGRDLETIRNQGYAITHEEDQEDLSAVAAPIFDHAERVVASVVVSGPTYRMGPDNIESFIKPVQETAHEISVRLGSIGNSPSE